MCGIVGVAAEREVSEILLEGLRRLEYRGYDSAGIATLDSGGRLHRRRCPGKVAGLAEACQGQPLAGQTGIAHTRWATHGEPSQRNAHPQTAGGEPGRLALVHNGIIENHEPLKAELAAEGLAFESETDTEVIAHLLHRELAKGKAPHQALQAALAQLQGAYALAVIMEGQPGQLLAARLGSPLIVGLGLGENYVASDALALRPVTDRFIYLEEGEMAEVSTGSIALFGKGKSKASLKSRTVILEARQDAADKGSHRHYMQKEIFEQPEAITRTLAGRLGAQGALPEAFGPGAAELFAKVRAVQIVACGSSHYAGQVARHWFEEHLGMPCQVEIASEFRYRRHAALPDSLLVALSQSGETADTLAALKDAQQSSRYLASLGICNVPSSSLVRETDLALMLEAGPEICVASTKAFTCQLTALLLLLAALGRTQGMASQLQGELAAALRALPELLGQTLALDADIERLAEAFVEKRHALFLGRGSHYPIALEGALKLKEISYIHAEAYPAGELKHGPLALVDDDMPVVAVAPEDGLMEKLKSNLEEVKARGARLFVFAGAGAAISAAKEVAVLRLPPLPAPVSPIVHTLPVQLLAYHVACFKGTDVDQPRNLAKSVTVE